MEHLRNRLAHELKQVAVGGVPGDLLVVAEGVEVEVPGGGQDDGDQVAGRHPHQDSVGRRPHAWPQREREGEYFPFQLFLPVLPGEYEDDETVEDESDEDQLR